jgi:murein DD-endopeptidase MepM/ murein hydrolase activator NlpD
MKRAGKFTLTALIAAIILAAPSLAYYFQGYYVPTVLVSPMRDDILYTPVGMGVVTSKAGFRVHPVTGRGDFHNGVDLAANLNDKVYCLLPGMVTRVGWRGNMGVAVEVYCPYPNVRVICGHLNGYSVQPGMWVQRGRVIGYAGSTGRSTGVHVHYTVIKEDTNQYIDPMAFLLQVPQYMAALRSAQGKQAVAKNLESFKKAPQKTALPGEDEKEIETSKKPEKEEASLKGEEAPPPAAPDAEIPL